MSNAKQLVSFSDHLRELFVRIGWSLFVLLAASLVVYEFYEPILDILRAPLGTTLYYSNPAGSFSFIMRICLMGALLVTIPVIVYNIIMFVRPAFKKVISKKRIIMTVMFSAMLACAGALFAYYIILPGSLKFFAGFQVEGLDALISADNYLNYVVSIMTTFIIMFQIPLLLLFIDHVKPIKPSKLFKSEKYIVLASVAFALLTPFSFDILTMVLIALPAIVLYNLSIAMVLLQQKRRAKKSIKHSTIMQPKISTNAQLDPSLIKAFSSEAPRIKPAIISQKRPTLTNNIQPRKTYMDFAVRQSQKQQATQIQSIAKPIKNTPTTQNKSGRFMDVRPPRSKRALV